MKTLYTIPSIQPIQIRDLEREDNFHGHKAQCLQFGLHSDHKLSTYEI